MTPAQLDAADMVFRSHPYSTGVPPRGVLRVALEAAEQAAWTKVTDALPEPLLRVLVTREPFVGASPPLVPAYYTPSGEWRYPGRYMRVNQCVNKRRLLGWEPTHWRPFPVGRPAPSEE